MAPILVVTRLLPSPPRGFCFHFDPMLVRLPNYQNLKVNHQCLSVPSVLQRQGGVAFHVKLMLIRRMHTLFDIPIPTLPQRPPRVPRVSALLRNLRISSEAASMTSPLAPLNSSPSAAAGEPSSHTPPASPATPAASSDPVLVPKRDDSKASKAPPNYFLSLRITNPAIIDGVRSVQNALFAAFHIVYLLFYSFSVLLLRPCSFVLTHTYTHTHTHTRTHTHTNQEELYCSCSKI